MNLWSGLAALFIFVICPAVIWLILKLTGNWPDPKRKP